MLGRTASAAPINYCVFDPLGTQGDYFSMAKDYQLTAKRWGVELVLQGFTDETRAVAEFKAGNCDAISMTGLRARLFNTFTGTIDAPGAVEDYPEMRIVMSLVTSPKLASHMISGPYEVAGMIPIGGGYPFVNDRRMCTVAAFAGKRAAVMGWDPTEPILAEQFGVRVTPADIPQLGHLFNDNKVDTMFVPAVLYKPFELYRGMTDKNGQITGGIVRRAVLQLTLQMLIRRDKFPPGFGQQSRDYYGTLADGALGLVRNVENGVDTRHWIYMTRGQRDEFYNSVRSARVRLAKEGFYDKSMLGILKRVRCKTYPDESECRESDE